VSVPDAISVVGFDDVLVAPLVIPPLTTVRQPLADMGRFAVSMLRRLIDGRPLDAVRVELATSLVVRDSCAAPTPPTHPRP
jgi:LacI family transcriptional regulator